MKKIKFSQILDFQKKSHIKAGDGLREGSFPFFTSSPVLSKYITTSQFDFPSLIFGTGGSASVHMCGKPFSVSTDCLVAQLKSDEIKNFEIKFIYYYLSGNISILEKGFKGAGLRHISKSYIDNIDIPEIPIEDQKRMVKLLDEADTLRQKRKQAIILLDDYLKSVFLEMFGDPVSNPKEWETERLNNACLRLSDGPFGSKLKSEHYVENGVRVIRLQNIGINKFKDGNKAFVSESYHNSDLKKYSCRPGEIVIATLGDPNIRACLIPDHIQLSINKADCIHCIPNDQKLNSEYLLALLNLPQFHHSFYGLSHGETRSRVSSGQLKNVKIPLPRIDLQDNFSQIVQRTKIIKQRMLLQAEELETQFQASAQEAFGLGINCCKAIKVAEGSRK